jgi:hypothetical protein
MSFQRSVPTRETFFKETNYANDTKYQTKGMNFLGKTYQKLYQQPTSIKSSLSKNQGGEGMNMSKKNENIPNYMVVNTNRYSSRVDSNIH